MNASFYVFIYICRQVKINIKPCKIRVHIYAYIYIDINVPNWFLISLKVEPISIGPISWKVLMITPPTRLNTIPSSLSFFFFSLSYFCYPHRILYIHVCAHKKHQKYICNCTASSETAESRENIY